MERKVLLEGKLIWDPNLEHDGPNPDIQRDFQRLKNAFEPYYRQIVLVQAIDTIYKRLLIGQQSFEHVDRQPSGRGGNFYMWFGHRTIGSFGTIGNYHGHLWYFSANLMNISCGTAPLARAVGADRTIIYQDPELVEKWNEVYREWIKSIPRMDSFQMAEASVERALSRNLLRTYDVLPDDL